MAGLLAGIRILDLTNVLAGPFCCYQLAQLGADVIKVEAPGTGDLARQLGADPELNRRHMGASFLAQNAGKRSITINLKSDNGREVFRRLVATSYVVVENFRPGVMARLGLDSPTGSERMTDLADGVVYSRSGLTYQAGLLEKAGLVTRAPSADDERGVTVTITDAGRALLAKVLPGHTDVISRQLFQPLPRADAKTLAELLSPVRDHMRSAPPRSAAPRRRH